MRIKCIKKGIFARLTWLYFIYILIPISFLCIYNYIQLQESVKKEVTYEREKFTQGLKNDINNKVGIIKNVANNISYNTMVQQFLGESFDVNKDSLFKYAEQVYPVVSQAIIYNQTNIQQMRIFMNNPTIPEGWGIFWSTDRVSQETWYQELMASENQNNYLSIQAGRYFDNQLQPATNDKLFVYLQKIFNLEGKCLGVLALEIDVEDFFLSYGRDEMDKTNVYLLDKENQFIVSSDESKEDYIMQRLERLEQEKVFEDEEELYMLKKINEIDATIITTHSLTNQKVVFRYSTTNSTILIGGLIMSLILFYAYIRNIFTKIEKNIKIMSQAVQGNLDLRIPVESKDEIGMIAESFNSLIEKNNALIKDIVKKEVMQKTTELRALQFQINPHFFYNTLDILASKMMMCGNYEVADAIADFGKMLRYNISNRSMHTTLDIEVQYVKQYISIQKLKYDERLQLNIELPNELKRLKILKFILQPIIENSMVHGFENQEGLLEIKLRFSINEKDELIIRITDNGKGMDEKSLEEMNTIMSVGNEASDVADRGIRDRGIGLENINQRLKLFYGDAYGIKMESNTYEGTTTIISIPEMRIGESTC